MIIEQSNVTRIQHDNMLIQIEGNVRLMYDDKGLTVIVNSIPELTFYNVGISDIVSDITIELI